jgi:hypothetical protein
MQYPKSLMLVGLALSAAAGGAAPSPLGTDERVFTDPKGRIIARPLPVEERFRNPWPAAWEDAFWDRANASLRATDVAPGKYGGTFFENEKASYPNAFIGFLKGQQAEALKFLQQDDSEPWSRKLTLGVDWFPSFTIKSQTRKYFFFGQYLDPAYRQRMFDSAKIWTEQDPLRRPNPFWLTPEQRKAKGMTGEGWTPEFHNSWVDVRNTDNLRAMRECAVYLMAEETGNAEVVRVYRERIRSYVAALYTTGMGEWDSANYLSHALTGYLQLYDFARDPEVKLLAKAHLDWVCSAAAVKYFRGCWGGPNIRDYGNIGPHSGAAGEFWHYFGELAQPAEKPYRDFVHIVTSAYRPPAAVVELAHKNFPKPVEILASKPSYEGWFKGGEKEPTYFETTFIGHHSQLGSLPNGHLDPPGMNLNGFRLLAENSRRGADTLIVFTSLKFSHSIATATAGGDQLAQYRGNLIWLNAKPDTMFFLLLPKSAVIKTDGACVCFQLEKTWLALHLIGLKNAGVDTDITAQVCGPGAKSKEPRFPDDQIWSAEGDGSGPCGFALEIGEPETDGDFATFVAAVTANSKLDQSKRAEGEAHFTSARGERVGLRLAKERRPAVWRNGVEHDWKQHWNLWAGDATTPITLGWKQAELRVRAGGREFRGALKDGRYTFENQ